MFENLISGIKHGLLSWYISQPWWRQSFIPSSCKYMYKFFSFFLSINLFITIFFNLSINLLRVFLCFNCCTHEVINTYYYKKFDFKSLKIKLLEIFRIKFNETCQKNHLSPFSLKKGQKPHSTSIYTIHSSVFPLFQIFKNSIYFYLRISLQIVIQTVFS